MRKINMIGLRFGRLTVLREAGKIGTASAFLCTCDCGSTKIARGYSLRIGDCQSCGCLRSEHLKLIKTSHGHYNSRTYHSFYSMKARCTNEKHEQFKDYGGRGISICKRWDNFQNFLEDMGERPDGYTLDRIDVNGDYEPSNCRWLLAEEQNRNKRIHKEKIA